MNSPGWWPLRPRDPAEPNRVSSPLELLTDLCFVVAVAQAAVTLHHELSADHVVRGIGGFAMAFFAIYWAWVNFTWFASAYDSDDVTYRLLTILQIVGSLMLAAGIPELIEHQTSKLAVFGYVVMRIALVTQWLRAASGDPPRRQTDRRYALGITLVQIGWLLFLVVPHSIGVPWFLLFVVLEMCVPAYAERHVGTTWHANHVADRYAAFFIIVLGETILSTTVAIQQTLDDHGSTTGLARVIGGGVLIVFSAWWLYFDHDDAEVLPGRGLWQNMVWGFGHYFVFAAAAAVGAGLAVRIEHYTHHDEVSALASALAVCVPVAVFVVAVYLIHVRTHDPSETTKLSFAAVLVVVLAGAFTAAPEVVAGLAVAALLIVTGATRRAGLHPPVPAETSDQD